MRQIADRWSIRLPLRFPPSEQGLRHPQSQALSHCLYRSVNSYTSECCAKISFNCRVIWPLRKWRDFQPKLANGFSQRPLSILDVYEAIVTTQSMWIQCLASVHTDELVRGYISEDFSEPMKLRRWSCWVGLTTWCSSTEDPPPQPDEPIDQRYWGG